mmetsp:Transcript_17400/g.19528  ORF Transcript_17400/g.19528 Transcript_17400/m.19528 type:complete len:93 (-) Transcript_17400:47-325(-)
MKTSAILLITLLLLTFATSTYAQSPAASPLGNLQEIGIACIQDIYEGVQLAYTIYDALVNNKIVEIIGLISEVQDWYNKTSIDCIEQVFHML